ncbi:hypothetical protein [Rhizobium halophytocola]|uniref:Transcriptional regulator n=1 Tax=Rhizobium halophytocola TaxID=735519 RepID=A0ABS4DVT5_9HYPH|nr:hypothetical protein [Rhizobium halophytocola]MBP1849793.1 hypothetical protein [Rhizobium halophytocola]
MSRQTPRVDLHLGPVTASRLACGRQQVKDFRDWQDGRPQTELNFKLYRQATDKLVGLSDATADFLEQHF